VKIHKFSQNTLPRTPIKLRYGSLVEIQSPQEVPNCRFSSYKCAWPVAFNTGASTWF
jgi:hypothetical protein